MIRGIDACTSRMRAARTVSEWLVGEVGSAAALKCERKRPARESALSAPDYIWIWKGSGALSRILAPSRNTGRSNTDIEEMPASGLNHSLPRRTDGQWLHNENIQILEARAAVRQSCEEDRNEFIWLEKETAVFWVTI